MAKRRIIIDGLKKWKAPEIGGLDEPHQGPSQPADTFDYESNLLRQSTTQPIRFRGDYWPVQYTKVRVTSPFIPILQHIEVPSSGRPEGCAEIWHVLPDYGHFEEDPNRVWAIVARRQGGGLVNVFVRAGLTDIKELPFGVSNIVSQNIRPLNKIRFSICEYFIPERNFMYIGYPYR